MSCLFFELFWWYDEVQVVKVMSKSKVRSVTMKWERENIYDVRSFLTGGGIRMMTFFALNMMCLPVMTFMCVIAGKLLIIIIWSLLKFARVPLLCLSVFIEKTRMNWFIRVIHYQDLRASTDSRCRCMCALVYTVLVSNKKCINK